MPARQQRQTRTVLDLWRLVVDHRGKLRAGPVAFQVARGRAPALLRVVAGQNWLHQNQRNQARRTHREVDALNGLHATIASSQTQKRSKAALVARTRNRKLAAAVHRKSKVVLGDTPRRAVLIGVRKCKLPAHRARGLRQSNNLRAIIPW